MPRTEENKDIFTYDPAALRDELAAIIQRYVTPDSWEWIKEKAALTAQHEVQPFMVAFAAMPRKTGRQPVVLSTAEESRVQALRPRLSVQHWPVDRLARVWLLMHLDSTDKNRYIRTIETLFKSAEMNEQVALYAALPVLAYPASWAGRCAEGVRSNIGDVLEAIMCDNPYPAEHLDEPAWNQLVLKAIFTEKPIHRIVNLDKRANQALAHTLSDYAHERWAAHRPLNPMVWRCAGKFIDARIFPDIKRIAISENPAEREAAALACAQSTYTPAMEMLRENAGLRAIIESGITWEAVAKKLEILAENS